MSIAPHTHGAAFGTGARIAIGILGCLAAFAACLLAAGAADAAKGKKNRAPVAKPAVIPPAKAPDVGEALASGAVRTTYTIGPIDVTPGQNRISFKPIRGSERPAEDGWITRIKPNLVRADGSVPKSSLVMFHHGVWMNLSRRDATANGLGGERFYATGEEKTIMELPDGYGYRYESSDVWLLNHMIHNLVSQPMELYVTYTVDFIPDTAPQAAGMIPVRPIWMDVDNGSLYPVFDVHRGSGGKDGKFTYPTDLPVSPYKPNRIKNEWTVDQDGVLVATTGHVHTGGLSTDLYLKREGASYAGPNCRKVKKPRPWRKAKKAKKKKFRKYVACLKAMPRVEGNRVHLFKSWANYFEPAGPVSWDVAMISTGPDWRVAVKKGDVLELDTTYETKLASWYESMGINVAYMAPPVGGDDPYVTRVDGPGIINHGHYEENDDHGGENPVVGPDPRVLPNGIASGGPFQIAGFMYEAGDFRLPGDQGNPPVVEKGQSFTFAMGDNDVAKEMWHSLTSCKAPCNKSTGIAYPIPDGEFQFDSGQLGTVVPPTVGRRTWSTPADLPVGTHTFFCRIHPEMRGAFRVVKPGSL